MNKRSLRYGLEFLRNVHHGWEHNMERFSAFWGLLWGESPVKSPRKWPAVRRVVSKTTPQEKQTLFLLISRKSTPYIDKAYSKLAIGGRNRIYGRWFAIAYGFCCECYLLKVRTEVTRTPTGGDQPSAVINQGIIAQDSLTKIVEFLAYKIM